MAIDRQMIADNMPGTGEKSTWYLTPDVTAGVKRTMTRRVETRS